MAPPKKARTEPWPQNPMQSINNHKFLNAPSDAVVEMLRGFVQSHPNVQLLDGLPDIKVVVRCNTLLSNVDPNKVAIVSGGGSGHEPAHAGFVGEGMLNAAVCGDVFASPSVAAVLAAIRHVCGPAGCLLIVKNYTGDRLNFGLAAERAKLEGFKVEMVVVGDDCALPPPLGVAGRRGLAGTLFVHKVAGAAADSGLNLLQVKLEAMEAAASVGTVGVAVAAHTLPGNQAPARLIAGGRMETGLGIHGEPGAELTPVKSAAETVGLLLEKITDKAHGYMKCLDGKITDEPLVDDATKSLARTDALAKPPKEAPKQAKVAVMINSLGATPLMELHVCAEAARDWLKLRNLNPARVFVGQFMTALNMTGISVSVMLCDQMRLNRLDYEVKAPCWPEVMRTESKPAPVPAPRPGPDGKTPAEVDRVAELRKKLGEGTKAPRPVTRFGGVALDAVVKAAQGLRGAEARLTEADTKVGDGDCGTTHARGASALMEDAPYMPTDTPRALAVAIGMTVRRSMGGTSGALYDIFFSAAGHAMDGLAADDPRTFLAGFKAGIRAMRRYGGAVPGHRTMLDALEPACEAAAEVLEGRGELRATSGREAARAAASAAAEGAARTRTMTAGAGRSSYVPEQVLLQCEDPGAMGAAAWLEGVARAVEEYLD